MPALVLMPSTPSLVLTCPLQALIMLRAGKKLLMEVELDGRRAIAAMARAPGPVCGAGLPPATPALTPLLLGGRAGKWEECGSPLAQCT